MRDLRRTLRTLTGSPWLSAAAIVSLALGIGANTAVFGLLHALLLEPLPFPAADRLIAVYTEDRSAAGGPGAGGLPLSHPNFQDLEEENRSLSHLAGWVTTPVAFSVEGAEAERVPAQLVSEDYFPMLGLEAARGRFFTAAQVERGDPVAVLSHAYWQRRLGSDPQVVGRSVRINGAPFQVVAVAPPELTGTSRLFSPSLWLPMGQREALLSGPLGEFFESRRGLVVAVAGRLAPGVSREQADEELAALGARLEELHPEANRDRGITTLGLAEASVPPPLRRLLTLAGGLLLAVAGLVLLVACANVANLLLVRAASRRREVALRLSLGEGRGRLVRSLFLDALVLAACGGLLGTVLAYLGSKLLWNNRPPMLARMDLDLSPDPAVLGFATLLALGTALLFALAPARRVLGTDLTASLKERGAAEKPGRAWGPGRLLVVFQVALSVVALAGAGLFLGSLQRLQEVDPGFEVATTASLAIDPSLAGYDPVRGRSFLRRVVEEAEALPGVRSATLGSALPMGGVPGVFRTVFRQGVDGRSLEEGVMVSTDVVGPDYFETLGIPVRSGRALTAADREEAPLVVVVNRTMSERLWPEGGALGRRLSLAGDDRLREVVGIVEDSVYTNPGADPELYLYLPMDQQPGGNMRLFLRTAGDPAPALAALGARVRELEPNLPIEDAATMEQVASRSLWAPRFATGLLGIFGLLALVLSAIGIYGVLSYRVTQRRHEVGVRMALGAARGSVVKLVVRLGMAPVLVGLVAGLVGAVLLGQAIRGLLYGVRPAEPWVLGLTCVLLLGVALVACLLPARRATRLDPAMALRVE